MDRKPSAQELTDELVSLALELRDVQQRMDRMIALLSHAAQPARKPLPETLEHWLSAHRDELPAILLAAVQASAAPSQAASSLNSLKLDPNKRVATIGSRQIPLSQSEFKILELLWRAAPQPVSRRMMLECLYRGKEQPNETVTDVFIYNIRQKLKNAGSEDAWIVGVRGIGWSLAIDGGLSSQVSYSNDHPGTGLDEHNVLTHLPLRRSAGARTIGSLDASL